MSEFRFFKPTTPFSQATRDMYRPPSGPTPELDPLTGEPMIDPFTGKPVMRGEVAAQVEGYGKDPADAAARPADIEQERRDALKTANTGLGAGAAGTGLSGGAAGTGLSGGAAGTGLGAGKAGRGVETGQLETYGRGGVASDPRGGFGKGKKVGGRGHAAIAARNAARAAAKKRKEQEGQQ
jgi:hypothetical protein